jgi:hypothetical protein
LRDERRRVDHERAHAIADRDQRLDHFNEVSDQLVAEAIDYVVSSEVLALIVEAIDSLIDRIASLSEAMDAVLASRRLRG